MTASARTGWQLRAACAQLDNPDAMFPGSNTDLIREARRVCQDCPVLLACLRTVLRDERGKSAQDRWGIYAGLTPSQRARTATRLRAEGRL
ncbi:WhiB family transcriptional regulator [Streptomyces sp. NPDC060194]|uniref:WhiB family transcriptional regulator n=1 Tax=Streptomyces sp. NPDC060194 TaxID=3347069 RepID=UPI00366A1553